MIHIHLKLFFFLLKKSGVLSKLRRFRRESMSNLKSSEVSQYRHSKKVSCVLLKEVALIPIHLQTDIGSGQTSNFLVHGHHMTIPLNVNKLHIAWYHKTRINLQSLWTVLLMSTSTTCCKYTNDQPRRLECYEHNIFLAICALQKRFTVPKIQKGCGNSSNDLWGWQILKCRVPHSHKNNTWCYCGTWQQNEKEAHVHHWVGLHKWHEQTNLSV